MQQFVTSLGIFLKGAVDRTPSIRARDWNERIVAPCERCLLLPGAHTTSVRTPHGQILSISADVGWHHPWFPSVGWDKEGWHVRVRPGFVNGQDPAVPGHEDLLAGPKIRLTSFRAIPAEGEPVPKFFSQLGVQTPKQAFYLDAMQRVVMDTTQRAASAMPPRLLAACDIWVSVARATYRGVAQVVDASGVSGEVVDYSVTFDTTQLDRVGMRPRLLVGEKMPAVLTPTLSERLNGQFQDDGEDRLRIATLYFLSPPDATDPTPNQLWQPYPSNNAFWNLAHAAKNPVPKKPPAPIRMFTGLAGGWADIIGNQMLSGTNELSARASNAVNTTTNEGRFWNV